MSPNKAAMSAQTKAPQQVVKPPEQKKNVGAYFGTPVFDGTLLGPSASGGLSRARFLT